MIDILLSTYNGEKYLREQLDSLFVQTNKDLKVLIRDDCSNDKTLKIIEEYKNIYFDKIQIIDNKGINLGSSRSFFELLRHSHSEFIAFCDQDDIWIADKLNSLMQFYNENVFCPDKPVLIHTAATVVDKHLNVLKEQTVLFNKNKCGMEHSLTWQVFQNDVTGCTAMINACMRDIVNRINFSQYEIIQHDWLLALIAYLNDAKIYLPAETVKYRQHEKNVVGVKRQGFFSRMHLKLLNGISYKYYDQVETLLKCDCIEDAKIKNLLFEFADLKNKNKLFRIFWHIRHRFFREGNILYKLYQLFAC